jgi:hypothetical protein
MHLGPLNRNDPRESHQLEYFPIRRTVTLFGAGFVAYTAVLLGNALSLTGSDWYCSPFAKKIGGSMGVFMGSALILTVLLIPRTDMPRVVAIGLFAGGVLMMIGAVANLATQDHCQRYF